VAPLVYEGSGPLDRDRASRVAVFDSNASRQGKAIAGFEASAKLAAELLRAPWVWNNLFPLCCLAACDTAGVVGLGDTEDEYLAHDFCRAFVDLAAIRPVATMLLAELMVVDI
jgi:CHAT domain-containing protein